MGNLAILALKAALALAIDAIQHVTPDQIEAVKKLIVEFLKKLTTTDNPAKDIVVAQFTSFDGANPDTYA